MGEISNVIILIASIITAVTTIIVAIQKILKKTFEPINKKIDNIDLGQARNYLVDFLADIEAGVKKDECQIERAYELYDHYTKDLGGNSYIHSKWGKIMKERKVD
jgi:hypothetical protein|nr:MAG TPA: hypothetical protein [Caudoviricetes sp.]DAP14848.1 MAG TPA: hypothetical protein [Caudoviricetes sp.]